MSFLFLCAAAVAVDGDTLRCANVENAGGRVRLAAIDAPELPGHCRKGRRCAPGDPYKARAYLASLIKGRAVQCEQVDASPDRKGFQAHDPYGRIVARCRSGDRDLGKAMISAGRAIHWPR
jgi:endonuclease YncB( thermonuclease family)